jgi:antitoxin component of MazEF toxin-antitoxin module
VLDQLRRYIQDQYMKRKLVQAGGSLAVTLPAEIVQEFGLEKGMAVDVSVHPQSGAVVIRPGVRTFEGGDVTERFRAKALELVERRAHLYRKLAE